MTVVPNVTKMRRICVAMTSSYINRFWYFLLAIWRDDTWRLITNIVFHLTLCIYTNLKAIICSNNRFIALFPQRIHRCWCIFVKLRLTDYESCRMNVINIHLLVTLSIAVSRTFLCNPSSSSSSSSSSFYLLRITECNCNNISRKALIEHQ